MALKEEDSGVAHQLGHHDGKPSRTLNVLGKDANAKPAPTQATTTRPSQRLDKDSLAAQ